MSIIPRFEAFLRELRRRRVGRVAAAYAVTGWVLVEIADTIFPRLLLPEWTVSVFIALVLLGFPVALLLAWWFDVVPDTGVRSRRRWLMPIMVSVIILSGAGFASARFLPRLIGAGSGVDAIVVLPFDDATAQTDDDFFVEGMQHQLIAELSQISSLRVISRRSAAHYRASKLSTAGIARELDVDAVIEGAVQRTAAGVQVRVSLIRARPREEQIWTQTFTRDERDVLALHDDVARNIAQQIRLELTDREAVRLSDAARVDPRTYELYLRGLHIMNNRTGRPAVLEALKYLHQAVDLDPGDARTYAALANGYATLGHAWVYMPEAWPRARAAAQRAIALDAQLADGYHALAKVKLYHEFDWPGAEQNLRKALELNPNLADTYYEYAFYQSLFGRRADAVKLMERARDLDPFRAPFTGWLGHLYQGEGDLAQAEAAAKQAIEIAPTALPGYIVLGRVYSTLGKFDEAIAVHKKLVELNPLANWMLGETYAEAGRRQEALAIVREIEADSITPFRAHGLAVLHARLGNFDDALTWLNYDGAPHAWTPWLRNAEVFAPVRRDPRFIAALKRMNLQPPSQ